MKRTILTILDGVGIREEVKGNAFKMANTPNFDYLWKEYPHSLLEASGKLVGLPEGQMGNSEVGHLNIGAGRIVNQPLQLINNFVENKSFFSNSEILNVMNYVKNNNSRLHIMGLVSDGGIHSHINHAIALLKMAKENNINEVFFHVITDGRDTLPDIAHNYVDVLEDEIKAVKLGKIATIIGRYYAMDRDNNWERTKKAYDLFISGIGKKYNNAYEAVKENHNNNINDEFIEPSLIDENGIIKDNDGIVWFNFRPERGKQILSAITNPDIKKFESIKRDNIKLVSMMPISDQIIYNYAFKLEKIDNTLGEYISTFNKKQLRIAETEKYAHVTYFFDGGLDKDINNCNKILINSPKVATYDLKPEMSCNEVTDKLLEEIDKYDLIVLNYANGDMVGHTGNIDAAKKAVEAVDYNLGRLYNKAKELDFTLIVTADHGNCEYMLDENDNVITSHTTNKVPFIVCNKTYKIKDGKLGDISPTILKMMDIDIPKEMTGEVLSEIK